MAANASFLLLPSKQQCFYALENCIECNSVIDVVVVET